MTDHPTDRLTDLVDGTLAASEREEVLAHVATCRRCTSEVHAAAGARDALRALPDPVVPPALGDRAVGEARRAVAGAGRRGPWARALPALGAAAVLVLAVAIFLPRVGDDAADVTEAAGAVSAAATPATRVEVLDTDFDAGALFALAGATAAGADSGAEAASQPTATFRAADEAIGCLTDAFRELPGVPVRLIEARYDGDPAYLAVLEAGPGAGQAPDRRYVLVASRPDCRLVSQTKVPLP